MSFHPEDPGGPRLPRRPNPPRAQGASRGGLPPDDSQHEGGASSEYDAPYDSAGRPRDVGGSGQAPFGGYPFGSSGRSGGWQGGSRQSGGWGSKVPGGGARFLGLPVGLIYAIGASIIAIIFIGAVCGSPTATGTVAGQVKALSAERVVSTLAGAELTLRGNGQTYTTTSTDADPNAEGEAAYNYRFENVPPGTYALTVTPPAGSNLQSEEAVSLEVESGQLFPQSVMLLAQGIQKPRLLTENELQPGEAGGYINDKGERVVYQQGSGFDASDALLMYLLWRNPPYWGYGAPPVIVSSPGGSSRSSYRVADPPTRTSSGQTVTQQRPSTPGQGASRPSSGSGATGSAPSRSGSSTGDSDAVKPSTGTGAGSSTTTRPNTPSQGSTRPSSSSSSPSRSSAPRAPSRSSGGGRR